MQDDAAPGAANPLTVLFADISGSSLLYAVRGDAAAFNLMSACLNVMEEQVRLVGGRVIKRVGDEVMAIFDTAEAAVSAAAGIQRAVDQPGSELHRESIHVRVGISTGTALLDAGDVYGDVVNVGARLVAHASPGEIFLSGPAYDELPATMRESARFVDQVVLRGRPSAVLVYQYLWKPEDMTVAAGGLRGRVLAATLEVTYGATRYVVSADHPKLRIGRAADNDITIDQELVSRYHAEISLRGDKFFLADSSTNGTYLHTNTGEPLRVSREAVTLGGSGRILPGAENVEPIHFQMVRAG
jgi:adenylate cyclase